MPNSVDSQLCPPPQPPSQGKLFAALAKAQGEMKPATLDCVNPHFNSRYASLTAVQDAIRDPLARNGLALLQLILNDGSSYSIRTILGHASGETIESTFRLLVDGQNMQKLGSAITYARRYGISAMLGVVDTEDDDGNGASTPPVPPRATATPVPPKAGGVPAVIPPKPNAAHPGASDPFLESQAKLGHPTTNQLGRLYTIATEMGWTHDQVKLFIETKWALKSSKDLTMVQYEGLIDTIQNSQYQQAVIGDFSRSARKD